MYVYVRMYVRTYICMYIHVRMYVERSDVEERGRRLKQIID